jgi:hypothetical protein
MRGAASATAAPKAISPASAALQTIFSVITRPPASLEEHAEEWFAADERGTPIELKDLSVLIGVDLRLELFSSASC